MAKASTAHRQEAATKYITERAPDGLNLRELKNTVEADCAFPRLATLRQREKVARAAQLLLDTDMAAIVPSVSFLFAGDLEREKRILRMLASCAPDAHEMAMTRCPDNRARLAYSVARFCDFWKMKHLGARFVMEAAIAWGIERPPHPNKERDFQRAWERRVKDARKLAKWSQDTDVNKWSENLPDSMKAPLTISR